jgi:hypothetical protein
MPGQGAAMFESLLRLKKVIYGCFSGINNANKKVDIRGALNSTNADLRR